MGNEDPIAILILLLPGFLGLMLVTFGAVMIVRHWRR